MNVLGIFKSITTLVFDIDGVLTDGTLLILPAGVMARRMNIKDGYALQLAVKRNYTVAIISGGNSPDVEDRLHKLGIRHVFMSVQNKLACLDKFLQEQQRRYEEVLFMGDDIPDVEVMEQVGLPCCPADAVGEIKAVSKYISPINGGFGCGRDVIEKVLKVRGHWAEDTTIRSQ
ncbi:3-deoxy-D-manno-octulosonate 8-phosphate phosphatase [Segetibacter sp. 3557_3]|uniref:KdsC family phosphatase n=1 Tax=Segetibacter sp. 3557_3 TaxID=2547429 RepID=UPI001058916F|nr:HAD family hydrolase [Segetibacter sp. 3557_3]TDH26531.1 3-deoxy-D-manno-octulosonate 8-phosphate phosphatase [Segetibacter sp. 3557_3]